MDNRIYRSHSDRMLAGVCGGLGRYLGIDSTLVRLFFVLLTLGNGIGFWVYVVLWIVVPAEPIEADSAAERERSEIDMGERAGQMGEDFRRAVSEPDPRTATLIGGALILIGGIVLVDNLNVPWLWWLEFDILWPALLILGGLTLIYRRIREV